MRENEEEKGEGGEGDTTGWMRRGCRWYGEEDAGFGAVNQSRFPKKSAGLWHNEAAMVPAGDWLTEVPLIAQWLGT